MIDEMESDDDDIVDMDTFKRKGTATPYLSLDCLGLLLLLLLCIYFASIGLQ